MSTFFEITTKLSDIEDFIADEIKALEKEIVAVFKRTGEECINIARVKESAVGRGDYTDRTGNLRSSIGYVVLIDGVSVGSRIVSKTKDGDKGRPMAQSYIKELSKKYKSGIVLIVVSGMEYGAYVQARGFDVLSSAKITMQSNISEFMKRLSERGLI